jgi:formate hydrogenlyase subunit 4
MGLAQSAAGVLCAFLLSPLLGTVIARTKAAVAGRHGPPLLQPYYELAKLLNKGAVYSRDTSRVFRAGSVVGLTASACVLFLVPDGGHGALVAFEGDFILFAYLLALGRFATVLAAMDTGSAFAGMGASREAFISALAEPVFLVGVAGLALLTRSLSLTGIAAALDLRSLDQEQIPALILIAAALLIVFLAENSRLPVDDPATHLELTMIHEAMILDHGGPDLAMIEYGGHLKMWALGLVLVNTLPLRLRFPFGDLVFSVLALLVLAGSVGVIEATMARLRLKQVPRLLAAAFVLSSLGVIWIVR